MRAQPLLSLQSVTLLTSKDVYSTVLDFEYSPANFHFKFVNHFFFIYFF